MNGAMVRIMLLGILAWGLIALAAVQAQSADGRSFAYRFSDGKVVLHARMIGPDGCTALGNMGLGVPLRGANDSKALEESILVFVERPADLEVCARHAPLLEKKAVLKMKRSTRWLNVYFIDAADRVYKSERIKAHLN